MWRFRQWSKTNKSYLTLAGGLLLLVLIITIFVPQLPTLADQAIMDDKGEADSVVIALINPVREPATGPLTIHPTNPRYFANDRGDIVYLTGSHTWSNLQDNGGSDPPPAFDYHTYLDFLVANNHNFFRLWTWEESRWTLETDDNNYWFNPMPPFARTGP